MISRWAGPALFAMIGVASCLVAPVPGLADDELEEYRKLVPGTGISLVPPDGFQPAATFDGFQHVASGASIMVTQVAGPYAQISLGLSMPHALRQRGMELVEGAERPAGDEPGKLVRVEQEANGIVADKWIRVFGSSERTAMIVATIPRSSGDTWMPRLRTSVLTARWDERAGPRGPFDGTSFRLRELGGLQFVSKMGGMLMFTPDGEPDSGRTGKPLFLAGPSIAPRTPSESRDFAEERIRNVEGHRVTEIESVTPVEIDGMSGLEIVAKAMDRDASAEAVIWQTMLFDGAGYWRSVGIARESDREPMLESFRNISRSLERIRTSHESPGRDFGLTAPGGWIHSSREGQLELTHTGAGCQIIAVAQPEIDPGAVSLDQVAELLTSEFPAEKRDGPREREVGGRPALETVVQQKGDPNSKLIVVVRGEKGYYVLIAGCPSWAFAEHRSSLDEVIATFEELEPK